MRVVGVAAMLIGLVLTGVASGEYLGLPVARVSTVWCKGTTAFSGGQGKRPPPSFAAVVPAGQASDWRVYYAFGARVVAPKGWRCTGSLSTGGWDVSATQPLPPGVYGDAPFIEATIFQLGNHSAGIACRLFASAHQFAVAHGEPSLCWNYNEIGATRVSRISTTLVKLTLPYRVGVTWVWWYPRTQQAYWLLCHNRVPSDICATAFANFNRFGKKLA
jgi:hypothetical protein